MELSNSAVIEKNHGSLQKVMSDRATVHTRRGKRNKELQASTIATRAMMAAQMAVAVKVEAKKVLKAERRESGVPIYYAQNLVSMISHTVEMAGQCSAASLAALEHLNLSTDSKTGGQKQTLMTADSLAKSAAFQLLSASSLFEALVSALASREASRREHVAAYDADSE